MLQEITNEDFKIDPKRTVSWTPATFYQGPLLSAINELATLLSISVDDALIEVAFNSKHKNRSITYNGASLTYQQLQEWVIASYLCILLYQNGGSKFRFSLEDSPDIVLLKEDVPLWMLLEIVNPNCNNVDEYKKTLDKKFEKSYWPAVGLVIFHNTRLAWDGAHSINISEIKRYMMTKSSHRFNQIYIWSTSANWVIFARLFDTKSGWYEDIYKELSLSPANLY